MGALSVVGAKTGGEAGGGSRVGRDVRTEEAAGLRHPFGEDEGGSLVRRRPQVSRSSRSYALPAQAWLAEVCFLFL